MAKRRNRTQADQLGDIAATTPTTKAPGKGAWKLMDRTSSIVAGLLAQRASAVAWRAVTGKKPPVTGRHPEVSTREAVAWAVVGGALIELVKVGVRRGTATYWVKSTGQLPPGMKHLAEKSGHDKEPIPTESAPSRASTRKVSRRSRGR